MASPAGQSRRLLRSGEGEHPMLTRPQLLVIGITAVGVGVVSGCEDGAQQGLAVSPTVCSCLGGN